MNHETKFVNLTPHTINVRTQDGLVSFPPSGTRALCDAIPQRVGEVQGIALIKTVWGDPQGLPEPQEGVIYIGSTLVAQAAARMGRTDVCSPDTGPSAIRENGQVVAVTALQFF